MPHHATMAKYQLFPRQHLILSGLQRLVTDLSVVEVTLRRCGSPEGGLARISVGSQFWRREHESHKIWCSPIQSLNHSVSHLDSQFPGQVYAEINRNVVSQAALMLRDEWDVITMLWTMISRSNQWAKTGRYVDGFDQAQGSRQKELRKTTPCSLYMLRSFFGDVGMCQERKLMTMALIPLCTSYRLIHSWHPAQMDFWWGSRCMRWDAANTEKKTGTNW